MSSLPVTYKSTPRVVSLVPEILWSAGALFASSLALMVSGAVVLLMMCLFRLADLSQKWDGDAVGQSCSCENERPRRGIENYGPTRTKICLDCQIRLSLASMSSSSQQRLERSQELTGQRLPRARRGLAN